MNVGAIKARVWQRLDDTNPGTHYGATSVLDAINEGQRLWCLLTLALEKTFTFNLTGGQAEYTNLRTLAGSTSYLLPLRLAITSTGARIRPTTVHELDGRDENWLSRAGTPTRYATRGFDYLAVYPQPAGVTGVTMICAAEPTVLTADGNTPEIPEEHHPDLVDWCEYRLRKQEGGQEFEKSLPHLDRFLEGAKKYGSFMRARSLSQAYDRGPFDLDAFDRSRLLRLIRLQKIVPQERPGAPGKAA
jgi:hypothetical protein